MITLTIQGENVEALLQQIVAMGARASDALSVGASRESADSPTPADTPKPNGGAEAEPQPQPGKRGRKKAEPATPAPAAALDREAIVKGLTEIYMRAEAKVRDRITAFRDDHGAQRLRDLKDDVLPEAAKLLDELKQIEAMAP